MPSTDSRPALKGLVLRPGTHVLRRSATELQVGLAPRRAVILPDRPATRRLLEALANPATVPSGAYDGQALALLADNGLLVDPGPLMRLAPSGPGAGGHCPELPRADVAALAARAGDLASELVAARRRAAVDVVPLGSAEADTVCVHVLQLLTEAGVAATLMPRGSAPTSPGNDHDVDVLVCVGEPSREDVDAWMRAGRPHLLVRLTEGEVVVGPFVLPGVSSCLRCVDAHHTDHDPAWPLLVTQYAAATTRERPDGLTEPVDGLLARLAGAWAAREAVTYAEGRNPPTASTTLRLNPSLTALETHEWSRHPACGCGWA